MSGGVCPPKNRGQILPYWSGRKAAPLCFFQPTIKLSSMKTIRHTFLLFLLSALMIYGCNNPGTSGTEAEQEAPEKEGISKEDSLAYMQEGAAATSATFKALSGRLKAALESGGVAEAVPYCNTVAMPLTDSMSVAQGVTIRRLASQYRNPVNEAKGEDLEVLNTYASAIQAGEAPLPQVRQNADGTIAYYSPIMLMELCTKCHGKMGETLQESDYELIAGLYPEDKAIGFAPGDLRGIWKVEFQAE